MNSPAWSNAVEKVAFILISRLDLTVPYVCLIVATSTTASAAIRFTRSITVTAMDVSEVQRSADEPRLTSACDCQYMYRLSRKEHQICCLPVLHAVRKWYCISTARHWVADRYKSDMAPWILHTATLNMKVNMSWVKETRLRYWGNGGKRWMRPLGLLDATLARWLRTLVEPEILCNADIITWTQFAFHSIDGHTGNDQIVKNARQNVYTTKTNTAGWEKWALI